MKFVVICKGKDIKKTIDKIIEELEKRASRPVKSN